MLCAPTHHSFLVCLSLLEEQNSIRMVDPMALGIIYPEEGLPNSAKIELAWRASCTEQNRIVAYFDLIAQAINAVQNLEGRDATQQIARLLDKRDALQIEMKENLAVMSALQEITLKLLAGAEQQLSAAAADTECASAKYHS